MAIGRFILLALIATSLISVATAIAGSATYYTVYTPSACYGFQDQGVLVAAANRALYNNGAACGRFYNIRCTGRTNLGVLAPCRDGAVVRVKVVDLCPGCGDNQFDLSQEAFSTIADLNAGRILIDYTPA